MGFFFRFATILGLLFLINIIPITKLYLVDGWTSVLARIAAYIINLFSDNVISYGIIIYHSIEQKGVSIEAGCNGIEAVIVLWSAILAFETQLGKSQNFWIKTWGMLGGFVAIQSLNVLRVIALFYLLFINKAWFDFAHHYLWPALIMLDVVIFFAFWLYRVSLKLPKPPDNGTPSAPLTLAE